METLVFILLCVYFLPSIIALIRGCNFLTVFLINLFLGWTVIGYFVALIIAATSSNNERNGHNATAVVNNNIVVHPGKDVKVSQSAPANNNGDNGVNLEKVIEHVKKISPKTKQAFTIIGCVVGSLLVMTICAGFLENREFYDVISRYESKSFAFRDLFDCKQLVDKEFKYRLCKCYFEYSLKIDEEYQQKIKEILNKTYEYSHQQNLEYQKTKDDYFNKAVNICSEAI